VKVVHAADLHVGKSRRLPGYLDRQDRMLAEIYRVAETRSDGLVLLAGDLYDRLDLTAREKDLLVKHVSRADRAGITTIVISGNHDMIDEDDGGYTHVRALKLLADSKRLRRTFVVETDPAVVPLDQFGVSVACVPAWYRKTKQVNDIMARLLQGIDGPVIALVHETVRASRNDRGQQFGIDVGNPDHCVEIDGSLPVAFWALGDVHVAQQIPGVPHAWYSGSPIQHDFGDADNKGVLVVDLERPEEPELVELAGIKKLVTVEVTDDQDPDIPADALVRLSGRRARIAELVVPDNVVTTRATGVQAMAAEAEADLVVDQDPLAGLDVVLQELGMSDEDVVWCRQEAERIRG
jgi:exonuclease SbcD